MNPPIEPHPNYDEKYQKFLLDKVAYKKYKEEEENARKNESLRAKEREFAANTKRNEILAKEIKDLKSVLSAET